MVDSRFRSFLFTVPLIVVACVTETLPDDDDGAGGGAPGTGGAATVAGVGGSGGSGSGGQGGMVDVAPTWTNFAQGFFGTYCTSCHSPLGQASADFNQLTVVRLRLNAIRCGTAPILLDNCAGEHPPGWFPVGNGPKPTDDERWTLVTWIENNAPE